MFDLWSFTHIQLHNDYLLYNMIDTADIWELIVDADKNCVNESISTP